MFIPDLFEGSSRAAPDFILRTLIRALASGRFAVRTVILCVHLVVLILFSGTVQAQTTPWPGGRWTPPPIQ